MTDLAFMAAVQERRITALIARGVHVLDPRQTYIDAGVVPERIYPGVILHPGTRLMGPRTFLGPNAELGREGPVTAIDCVLAASARIDGGYARDAVLLRGASAGSAAHLREGTLLEEEASTAHAVGLKHTILMSFVTIGSLVNFCDLLMAGGSSRRDHSEVGSGYIHFNFTPWGEHGDKATPSLVGDVPRGALLRARRIFLGGSGGMIGPRQVGFGAVAGAGQVLRKDVPEDRLVIQLPRERERPFPSDAIDPPEPRAAHNARFIAELMALRAWYTQIRLARAPTSGPHEHVRTVTREAIASIDLAISERQTRFTAFLRERGIEAPPLRPSRVHPCPLVLGHADSHADHRDHAGHIDHIDHIAWVQALPDADVAALGSWLADIVRDVASS